MNTIKVVIFFAFFTHNSFSQNFGQIALSSGSISTSILDATIGEVFVFSIGIDNFMLYAGVQSDQNNKGGLPNSVTSINPNKSKLTIFPNPVQNTAFVLMENFYGEYTTTALFQIFKLNGILLYEQKSILFKNRYSLNIETLPSGNYILKAYSCDGVFYGESNFIKL